jgi:hypothetical protein
VKEIKTGFAVGATVLAVFAIGTGGAVAGSLVTSADIKDGTVRVKDMRQAAVKQFSKPGAAGATGAQGVAGGVGPAGPQGPKGEKGGSGLLNAFYATAYYNAGDTNAGAIATVACDPTSSDYTAIAGGVQVLGLDGGANSRNTPVSSSFPGRMHWADASDNTDYPKVDRLDGWIVQFGGNAGEVSDKSPEKVKVWALCVPSTDIPVNQTYTQS